LKAWLAATTFLTGLLETWGQKVDSRRATVSLAAARQARASDRWRTAFEAAPLGMAKVNVEGRLEAVNSALRTLLGEPERAILGRRLSAFVYPDDLGALGGPGNPARAPKGVAKAEVRLVCAGGRLRWCELASSLVRDTHSRAEYVLVSVVDITRHKRSQAALRDLATRDPLSGLANRRWFELQLAQHLRMCADDGPRGALLVIDLDHFKDVNDNLGHQAGDRLVIEVAVSLRRHLRDQDVVARLGGDEFAVILREGDRWAAEAVARKLVLAVRDEVRATMELGEAPTDAAGGSTVNVDSPRPGFDRPAADAFRGVSVSIGVAPFELLAATTDLGTGVAAREALKVADAAMYDVKRSGRNGYALAGTDEAPRHARQRDDVPDLSAADPDALRAPSSSDHDHNDGPARATSMSGQGASRS
jgi:diguanylate cyclase (GGDEF)-like protein/PAS domain S-box-containing protein